jgi:hypothetical protein
MNRTTSSRFATLSAAHRGQQSARACVIATALVGMLAAPIAQAARPFNGTDAGVAQAGEFELEFGTAYLHQGSERTGAFPAMTANFGLAGNSELVLEGRAERLMGDIGQQRRVSVQDLAVSYKHVHRPGSLQDGSGISIASECGLLFSPLHGSPGHGAACAAIASQRWAFGEVHLNAALERTREHTWSRTLGVIVEGPQAWAVRPVMELMSGSSGGESRANSLLLGAIWSKSEDLAFDIALRKERTAGRDATEARFGLTWTYALHK